MYQLKPYKDISQIPNQCFLIMKVKVKVKLAQLCLTLSNPMAYTVHNSPGQNTGVGSLSLLQGIFPTQGSNPVSHTAGRFFTS